MAKAGLQPDREFRRWQRGFSRMPLDMPGVTLKAWRQVTDVFFSRSQQYVHILSGDLKRSGTSWVQMTGLNEVEGGISYGGEGVEYAEYEFERGGDHDAPALAFEATESLFTAALPGVWDRVVDSWR